MWTVPGHREMIFYISKKMLQSTPRVGNEASSSPSSRGVVDDVGQHADSHGTYEMVEKTVFTIRNAVQVSQLQRF